MQVTPASTAPKRKLSGGTANDGSPAPAVKKPKHSAQFSDPSHGDLTLVINEKHTFNVHRGLLSVWSPVMAAMLSNGMQETSQNTIRLREDDDKHAEHFGTFLDFMYPYAYVTVTNENVDALLHLADKYQVHPKINRACEVFLLAKMCDRDASWRLLLKAQRFGMTELQRKHARWLGASPERLHSRPLTDLDEDVLRECLSVAHEAALWKKKAAMQAVEKLRELMAARGEWSMDTKLNGILRVLEEEYNPAT